MKLNLKNWKVWGLGALALCLVIGLASGGDEAGTTPDIKATSSAETDSLAIYLAQQHQQSNRTSTVAVYDSSACSQSQASRSFDGDYSSFTDENAENFAMMLGLLSHGGYHSDYNDDSDDGESMCTYEGMIVDGDEISLTCSDLTSEYVEGVIRFSDSVSFPVIGTIDGDNFLFYYYDENDIENVIGEMRGTFGPYKGRIILSGTIRDYELCRSFDFELSN